MFEVTRKYKKKKKKGKWKKKKPSLNKVKEKNQENLSLEQKKERATIKTGKKIFISNKEEYQVTFFFLTLIPCPLHLSYVQVCTNWTKSCLLWRQFLYIRQTKRGGSHSDPQKKKGKILLRRQKDSRKRKLNKKACDREKRRKKSFWERLFFSHSYLFVIVFAAIEIPVESFYFYVWTKGWFVLHRSDVSFFLPPFPILRQLK